MISTVVRRAGRARRPDETGPESSVLLRVGFRYGRAPTPLNLPEVALSGSCVTGGAFALPCVAALHPVRLRCHRPRRPVRATRAARTPARTPGVSRGTVCRAVAGDRREHALACRARTRRPTRARSRTRAPSCRPGQAVTVAAWLRYPTEMDAALVAIAGPGGSAVLDWRAGSEPEDDPDGDEGWRTWVDEVVVSWAACLLADPLLAIRAVKAVAAAAPPDDDRPRPYPRAAAAPARAARPAPARSGGLPAEFRRLTAPGRRRPGGGRVAAPSGPARADRRHAPRRPAVPAGRGRGGPRPRPSARPSRFGWVTSMSVR